MKNHASTPADMAPPVAELYSLLGKDAVLLPLAKGTKRPVVQGWQNLKWADTQETAYQGRLSQGNIGVSLGEPSNGLCSVDCDSDDALRQFLELNPPLNRTLITSGVRGGNVWVKIRGPFPGLRRFENFGEWRSTGGQTVVWGTHPDGPQYRFVNKAPVATIDFESITWPDGVTFERKRTSPTPNHSSVSPVSVSESCIPESASCIPASLHNTTIEDVTARLENLAAIEARQDAWMNDKKNARIEPLYRGLVLRNVVADAGQRNAAMVTLGKRLLYAVSPAVALELMMTFFEINAPLFKASAEQHRTECVAILANAEATYASELTDDERSVFSVLPDRFRPPFRIFRDLANRSDKHSDLGTFFMSADGLGRRLGITCMEGDRILKRFIQIGILKVLTLGQRRAAGQTAMATLYQWLLPLAELAPQPSSSTPSDPIEDLFSPDMVGAVATDEMDCVPDDE